MRGARLDPSWQAARGADGGWTLTFDRPDSRQNSLDGAALRELDGLLAAVAGDPGATRLTLASGKPRGFCAGADLRAIAACSSAEEVTTFARLGQAVFERLRALPVPTVALVHGACLGGGLELALACRSIRVRDDAAVAPLSIGTPEVVMGLVPGWGAVGALPRRVGLPAALRLLLDGRPIDAGEAARIGLVDDGRRVTGAIPWPPEGWPAALAEARGQVVGDDLARQRVLEVLEADLAGGWEDGLLAAASGLAETAFSPAARAAIAAFLERKT